MTVETYTTPAVGCPVCLKRLDRATGGDEPPRPTDITVCIWCEAVLQFDANMLLVAVTQELYNSLPAESRRALAIARRAIARSKQRGQ